MLFTSYDFFIFLPIVFGLYWLLRKQRMAQNLVLLAASYVFYGWWDWRFLFLIFGSSTLDFFIANGMQGTTSQQKRKLLMWASVLLNIGLLCYFKYFNFFIDSFKDLLGMAGYEAQFSAIDVILPLGISFYTFQTLGYTIDVYKGKIKASKNFLEYTTFVSFFPQLVAGPIERATNLLPQFLQDRVWKNRNAVDGLRQILWGFFKKVAIADALAPNVNYIFANHEELAGSTLFLGAIMFTFQMYCDFSGYSDIAIGTARIFGFNLMRNFAYPFYSTSMSEFWRRWHISLSTWILDYLYTPISINRRYWGIWGVVFAAVVSFTLSGLWHGAAWTFVLWGLLHGIALGYEALTKKQRKKWSKAGGESYVWLSRIIVFAFWVVTIVIFRAETVQQSWEMFAGMADMSLFSTPDINVELLWWALGLVVFEYFQRNRQHAFDVRAYPYYIRWPLYAAAIILIFSSDNLNSQTEFIYFQF
jgi:alginate O-acetyltransferase complex protein AlgI